MKESSFQKNLVKELKERYPGCIVMKNDANYIQGIPDLTILYHKKWAALECKKDGKAVRQPNQEYYLAKLKSMSFASLISPEIHDAVLKQLDNFFGIIEI